MADDPDDGHDDDPLSQSAEHGIRDAWIATGAMAFAIVLYFVLVYLGVR